MLQTLSIQNYALIESLELNFQPNFTTITGETGSGKSILLGALGLILGERADTTVLKNKSKKCIVEGSFKLSDLDRNDTINDFFRKHDLDYEPIASIRREIAPSGRTRAFINDTPVTLNQLKTLTEQLVDIHSQHQTLTVNHSDFQLTVVDAGAGNDKRLLEYRKLYTEHCSVKEQLAALREADKKSKLDQDYFRFQLQELEDFKLLAGEEDALEQELETLSHSEEIKKGLHHTVNGLKENDNNVLEMLYELRHALAKIAHYNTTIEGLKTRMDSAYIELEDLNGALEELNEGILYDPDRIAYLSDRSDRLNGLMNKHRVGHTTELIAIREELATKIENITGIETDIRKLEDHFDALQKKLDKAAAVLTSERRKATSGIETKVHRMLALMAMPHARLQIKCHTHDDFGPEGKDRVQFLFKANKGGELKELSKVASGGELSRLMLGIKAWMAGIKTLPTIILDEIDTGISGDVANKAGNMMKEMAENMQVLCITHLPQIASKGDHHLKVYKELSNENTLTRVEILSETDRVNEIAKMLSGETLSVAAIENAKVLLNR